MGWANDVDMKVLPDDPIDPSTGLPKPTIVVASTLGISIMRGTGAMPEMTVNAAGSEPARKVEITKSNRLVFIHNFDWVYHYELPTSNTSGSYYNSLAGFLGRFTGTSRDWDTNGKGIPINTADDLTTFVEDRAIAHPNGLSLIDLNTPSDTATTTAYQIHCDIANDFNNGCQMGDEKRAQ